MSRVKLPVSLCRLIRDFMCAFCHNCCWLVNYRPLFFHQYLCSPIHAIRNFVYLWCQLLETIIIRITKKANRKVQGMPWSLTTAHPSAWISFFWWGSGMLHFLVLLTYISCSVHSKYLYQLDSHICSTLSFKSIYLILWNTGSYWTWYKVAP